MGGVWGGLSALLGVEWSLTWGVAPGWYGAGPLALCGSAGASLSRRVVLGVFQGAGDGIRLMADGAWFCMHSHAEHGNERLGSRVREKATAASLCNASGYWVGDVWGEAGVGLGWV